MSVETAAEFEREVSNKSAVEKLDGRKWTTQNVKVGDIVIVHPRENRKASICCSVEDVTPTGKISASAFHGGLTFSGVCHFADAEVNNKNVRLSTYEMPSWLLWVKKQMEGKSPSGTVDLKPLEDKISVLEKALSEAVAKNQELQDSIKEIVEAVGGVEPEAEKKAAKK